MVPEGTPGVRGGSGPSAPADAADAPPDDIYRLLVASIRDYAVFALDTEGRIVTWNAGAERLKGYRAHEIIGKHFSTFYPDDDVARGKPAQELRIAREYGRFEDEGWRIRADGSRFWANVTIASMVDPDTGKLVGFGKVTRDLTDRRQAEEWLRISEEKFRLLTEGVTDYAIILLDPEGRVQSWNTGARRLKGYRPNEIVGDHISRFYPREDVAAGKPQRELEVAARDGRYEDEGWRLRKDGTRFWANVVVTALRDPRDGKILGYSKVTRDLTERRRAEEALRRAYRDMEAFSYTVSHDLRAPLRAMTTVAEFLLRDHAKELTPEVQADLGRIVQSAERASRLVEDLLRFARASQGELVRRPVDVTALARDLAQEITTRTGRAVDLRVEDGIEVQADPALLRVALENVLANAWKFTARRGDARIEVGRSETPEGEDVVVVRDNGVGFDPKRARDIFQAFRRLHSDNEFEGSGIGLATVARIMDRHGGRAWADGKPGEGAVIRLAFPR